MHFNGIHSAFTEGILNLMKMREALRAQKHLVRLSYHVFGLAHQAAATSQH